MNPRKLIDDAERMEAEIADHDAETSSAHQPPEAQDGRGALAVRTGSVPEWTWQQWEAATIEERVRYFAARTGINEERQRKLAYILARDWNESSRAPNNEITNSDPTEP